MRVLIGVFVVLHLLGAAAIIGPWLAAPREPRIRMAMVWGARAQVVTGLLLVGLHEMSSDPAEKLDHVKIGVKLLVALACAACAEIANGRQRRAARELAQPRGTGATTAGTTTAVVPAAGLTRAAALLAVVNVCVAVLWS